MDVSELRHVMSLLSIERNDELESRSIQRNDGEQPSFVERNGNNLVDARATEGNDEGSDLGAGLLVVELHGGLGRSRKSGNDGKDDLLRILEQGEICRGLVSMRREAGKGSLEFRLYFRDADAAVQAVVGFWDRRLKGLHRLTPAIGTPNFVIRSKLDEELRTLFLAYILEVNDGPVVRERLDDARKFLQNSKDLHTKLKKKNRELKEYFNERARLDDLVFQHQQAELQITEFKSGLDSLVSALSGFASERQVSALALGHDWTWCQLHSLVERECERLEVRLPLYARRSDIVADVLMNQVTILIGETGSGKSTQLVQYLADAGYAGAEKTIVCTQPRKVAAIKLTERVKEESLGCLQSSFPVGCVTMTGAQRQARWADITFTTDFVLLQLCLTDSFLSQFSCIVVDEAHERSLNTDLLLALLKICLSKRPDLRVVVMSATADADLLSAYFGVANVLWVRGRNFPVQVIYEPEPPVDAWKTGQKEETAVFARVVSKVSSIYKRTSEGNILAFLTSQSEVEWACRQDFHSSAVLLPMYGKLQSEDLQKVFQQDSRGKRKIVFATNFAETSLTIPDVKFVVDCGLAKNSVFDPQSGMNILEVGKIDQSSAIQRAGRAGRTRPGVCYRLYSEAEFDDMASQRVPEIKRVHLAVAILKLLALGIKDPNKFDFVEAPDAQAILLAQHGLVQVGAVKQCETGEQVLTSLGWKLVKLGIEPKLGKILLDSIEQGYGQDGLVIVAVMSNSRSIFYRSGSDELKGRADRLKMRFCHPHGDLFTLLSVYQEWDAVPERARNKWCVSNSLSAKALRKCRDQVAELKECLRYELNLTVPSAWGWSPRYSEDCSTPLRKIVFAAMAANLAIFSGHERVGYDIVSLEQQQAFLHPSSAVLVYGGLPEFVVFGEILHTSCSFLVLITVVDPDWIMPLSQSLNCDLDMLQKSTMKRLVVPMSSSLLLSRVCGKQGRNLMLLRRKIQEQSNHRCIIDYSHENSTLTIFTTPTQMQEAHLLVQKSIQRERRWLDNECIEKSLIVNTQRQTSSPTLLYGSGGLIRDVLMPGEYAAVEVMYERSCRLEDVDDEDLLELFDQCGEGISGYDKFSSGSGQDFDRENDVQHHKWGIIRFCSSGAAEVAVELLNGATVSEAVLNLNPIIESRKINFSRPPFPAVKATLAWARRRRKGRATITCAPEDTEQVLTSCKGQVICGSVVSVKLDRMKANAIFLIGLDVNVEERTLQDALFDLCGCRVLDVYMPRCPVPLSQPSVSEVHQMLSREIAPFISTDKFQVRVYEPRERDFIARAEIQIEDSVHEGGTLALAHLNDLTLRGWQPWQKISHMREFSAQLRCAKLVLRVVNEDFVDLLKALQQRHPNTKISVSANEYSFHRVLINGTSLAVVAGCKSAIEKLMEGQPLVDDGLGELGIRLLFTKRGGQLAKAVEVQTQTLVMCDRRTRVATVYGPKEKRILACEELLAGLARLHSNVKCRRVSLRGEGIPAGLMREIVKHYGPDLAGLSRLAGVGAKVIVDHRGHLLLIEDGSIDSVRKVQTAVARVAHVLDSKREPAIAEDLLAHWPGQANSIDNECPICFSPKEDQYCLEGCGHGFCRSCLNDQINSAIRHRDGFPLKCALNGCSQLFLLADIHALFTMEQQQDLQSASLITFVTQSNGKYRFCMTPDCPNVYKVSTDPGQLFVCAACAVQLCTACHVEYHQDLSCAEYCEFKLDPDASLHAWRKGKMDVKNCPGCSSVIEKIDGCNHMTCKCGKHVCWVCLSIFGDPSDCYDHLRQLHGRIEGEFDADADVDFVGIE